MCNCSSSSKQLIERHRNSIRPSSPLINKWVVDNVGRKLLVQEPIYDIYNDIIGFITKNNEGQTIRIFESNIKQILN